VRDSGDLRILVAPLDWGMGHATRCIPVISELLKQGVQVVIGADRGPLKVLREAYPELEFVRIPGPVITYRNKSFVLNMLRQTTAFIKGLQQENELLSKIISDLSIGGVISDNRLGLYSKKVPTVIMSHQLNLKFPFLSRSVNGINRILMNRFSNIWIPDFAGDIALSGELSEYKNTMKPIFVGPLSRLTTTEIDEGIELPENFSTCILSGPEPRRTMLEKKVLEGLERASGTWVVVRGLPGETGTEKKGRHLILNYANSRILKTIFSRTDWILSRSGYSTVMDIVTMKKKAVFIPTPGQTEQEYLASYYQEKNWYSKMDQEAFNLIDAEKKWTKPRGFPIESSGDGLLKTAVEDFIQLCRTSND
jgi:hypothetical protein